MSEQNTPRRRKLTRNQSRIKPPKPSLSNSATNIISPYKPPKPIKVDLQRCHSEPILWTIGLVFDDGDDEKKNGLKFDGFLSTPYSCVNIFSPPSMASFTVNSERYDKNAKVVVNVTVEGSPGPVRSLIKLGASVEDTIKLVVDRYKEEGRRPQLSQDGVSSFELHHSHFSLESISKKDTIGEVGSRSFYLRKSCSGRSTDDGMSQLVPLSSVDDGMSQLVPLSSVETSTVIVSPFIFMPAFIANKMNKIGRRMCKLWKVLICSR